MVREEMNNFGLDKKELDLLSSFLIVCLNCSSYTPNANILGFLGEMFALV